MYRTALPFAPIRILIVEDERDIAANIQDFLERRGHVVDHVADGEQGLTRAMQGGFDIIVLDLGLPKLDGLEVCKRLRMAGNAVPVLMLTARDTLADCLGGFETGADDYLVKPFAMRELEVRIGALHRRGIAQSESIFRVGDLSYSPRSMLAERHGHSIPLTIAQGRILESLMRVSPNVVRREQLLHIVWGEQGGSFAALHTHICTLRVLIDRPFNTRSLQTVHGVGYRVSAHSTRIRSLNRDEK